MTRKLPALFVEQVHLGEKSLPVPPEELAELARSDAEIRATLPPLRRKLPLRPALGALALAAGLALALRQPPEPQAPEALESTLIKGNIQLLAWTPSHQRVSDGSALGSGDVLQLAFVSAGWTQGAILSVDGAGTVTQHLPEQGARSVELPPNGLLPSSFQLDDAPEYERFLFVTSDQPFELQPLIDDLRDGQLDHPPRGEVARLNIRKEQR